MNTDERIAYQGMLNNVAKEKGDEVVNWLLEQGVKDIYTTEEMKDQFEVHSFLAPFVEVTRKSDGVVGYLEFTHSPRYYYGFRAG